MKKQFNLTITVDEDDLLDKEVQKAIKAYAKSVARQAIDDEIEDEIHRIASDRARSLVNSHWGEAPLERLIRTSVDEAVKKEIGNQNSLVIKIHERVEAALEEKKKEIDVLVNNSLNNYFNKDVVIGFVKECIQKAVPTKVSEVIQSLIGTKS